jgi:exodeoxyribonuclease-5
VLTAEQGAVVRGVVRGVKLGKGVQKVGGPAGTGKTTIIRALTEELTNALVLPLTGKAVRVLEEKGIQAATIHRTIYNHYEEPYWDDDGRLRTRYRRELKGPWEVPGGVIIVDEASMVGKELQAALCSFDRPIVYVGDHAQLEPVGDQDSNLMLVKNLDYRLDHIHRHAGDIARFCEHLRKGGVPASWPAFGKGGWSPDDTVRLVRTREDALDGGDVLLCGKNKTRVYWNNDCRRYMGYPPDRPVVGDRVICLRNDYRYQLFNGLTGELVDVGPEDWITFRADEDDYRVRCVPEQFHSEDLPEGYDRFGRLPFDYAYCLNVHKAQGSEWDHVIVREEWGGWNHVRWTYTAASRARKMLTWWAP